SVWGRDRDLTPLVQEDDKTVKVTERLCGDCEEVDADEAAVVIVEESLPRLGGRLGCFDSVVGDGQFSFTGTFAFNLLMGRAWPPRQEDLIEAEALCRELGLGELLNRMPAGLMQMVGETGWRLSHGERSRLFLARALLQGTDLMILDESFGALDPNTLRQCMGCALSRARTMLVIAHP